MIGALSYLGLGPCITLQLEALQAIDAPVLGNLAVTLAPRAPPQGRSSNSPLKDRKRHRKNATSAHCTHLTLSVTLRPRHSRGQGRGDALP